MVLRPRQIIRILQQQVCRIEAPGGEPESESGQQDAISGQKGSRRSTRVWQYGKQRNQEPRNNEEGGDHPSRPPDSEAEGKRHAAVLSISLHIGKILRGARAQKEQREDASD